MFIKFTSKEGNTMVKACPEGYGVHAVTEDTVGCVYAEYSRVITLCDDIWKDDVHKYVVHMDDRTYVTDWDLHIYSADWELLDNFTTRSNLKAGYASEELQVDEDDNVVEECSIEKAVKTLTANAEVVRGGDLLTEAFGDNKRNWSLARSRDIALEMNAQGWKSVNKRQPNGVVERVWVKDDNVAEKAHIPEWMTELEEWTDAERIRAALGRMKGSLVVSANSISLEANLHPTHDLPAIIEVLEGEGYTPIPEEKYANKIKIDEFTLWRNIKKHGSLLGL